MNPPPPLARRIAGSLARLLLGAALLAGVLYWLAPDYDELRERVDPHPAFIGLGFVGTVLANLVTSLRWKVLTEAMGGTRLPYGVYFHHLALTRFLGQISSTLFMDLVGRGAALKTAGNDRPLGLLMAPLVLERILDLVLPCAMLAWALGTRFMDPSLHWPTFVAVCLAFFALSVPFLRPLAALALRVYAKLRRLRNKVAPDEDPPDVSLALAAKIAGLSLARYLTVILQFWAVGAAAGVMLPALDICGAIPVAQLAGLVGITPGGLGIQEVGWAGAMRWLGQPEASIAVFVVAARLFVILNFAVLSLISRPLLRTGRTPSGHR